jgi:hypothetical protein
MIVLNDASKAAIIDLLKVAYPLWQARPALDKRRVLKKVAQGTGFTMDLEPYPGGQGLSAFVGSINATPHAKAFEDALRASQPELLAYIVSPVGPLKIDGALAWLLPWCAHLDDLVPSLGLDDAIGHILFGLHDLLNGRANYVTTMIMRGLTLPDGVDDIGLALNHPTQGTLWLHRISPEEFSEYFSGDLFQDHVRPMELLATSTVIIHRYPFPISVQMAEPAQHHNQLRMKLEEVAANAVRALHITKCGRAQMTSVVSIVDPPILPTLTGGSIIPNTFNFRASMTLGAGDIPVLQEVFGLLLDCRPEVTIAANRLVDAEGRSKAEDVVVDSTIGLETLLLLDNQELTFRVQLNYAFLGLPEQRSSRAAMLKSLYKIRGEIVHGVRSKKAKFGDIVAASGQGTAALRDAILIFLRDEGLRKTTELSNDYWLSRIVGAPPAR